MNHVEMTFLKKGSNERKNERPIEMSRLQVVMIHFQQKPTFQDRLSKNKKKVVFFSILAGGRCPPDPPVFGWGGKAPPDPPLNGRSSHLIEAAKRGRLDQMIFFSAPLTTRAPPGRPAGRPAERPAGRPAERPAERSAGRTPGQTSGRTPGRTTPERPPAPLNLLGLTITRK